MRSAFRIHRRLLAASLLSLVACHGKDESGKAQALVDRTQADATIAAPAWLHDRLPNDTIAYARIPSPWGLIAAPDGRMLDPLLASTAHVKIVEQIRHGITTDPGIAQTGLQPALTLLFDGLASPIEIAVVGSGKVASPASQALLSARLRYPDVAALNAALQGLDKMLPLLSKPFDASGAGELSISGQAFPAQFDAANQRLFVLGGMGAAAGSLQTLIAQTATPHPGAMQPLEARIDQGGQGLFFWADVSAFRSAAAVAMSDPGKQSARDALAQIRGVAFGWGQVNGNGRMSLLVDAPAAKLLRYLPRATKQATLSSAGEPRWSALFALPSPQEWSDLHAALREDFGPDVARQWAEGEQNMKAKLGFDLSDVFGAVGPELQIVEDDAGTYAALRLRDAARFDALIKQLAAATGGSVESRDVDGKPFHSLSLPGLAAMVKDGSARPPNDALAIYARIGYHYYWVEQDGNLLLAQIPQTLVDYRNAKTRTDLKQWLTQMQDVDVAESLFAVTVRTHDTQRSAYAGYLGLLQTLGDASGVKLDMYSLPTADALHLPREGLLGLQLHASADSLGLDLLYQQNPLEILSNGGMAGVAFAGIAAAVALPAYQDYTVKAHIAETYAAANALKTAINSYYATNHKMPAAIDDLDLDEGAGDSIYAEAIDYEDNQILVTLNAAAGVGVSGKTYALAAYRGKNGELRWQCGKAAPPADAKSLGADSREATDAAEKYLPLPCRR